MSRAKDIKKLIPLYTSRLQKLKEQQALKGIDAPRHTLIQIEDIEALQTDEVPDIFLITDMQITNLAALIELFNERQNRVTAVHIGDNDSVRTFRRSMAPRKNVSIFAVEDKQSIPAIVLGKVKEYLYS